ncbi:hypothetical protein ACFLQ8_00215 [Candidatus Auribacterota bacterium]
MTDRKADHEKRTGNERRKISRRSQKKTGLLNGLKIVHRRAGLDRRIGLDRRGEFSKGYRRELIIKISRKHFAKADESEKAKMLTIWHKGLRAVTFEKVGKGDDVKVFINIPNEKDPIILNGIIYRTNKIYTEHGFATEAIVQFHDLTGEDIKEINNIIWNEIG